MLPTANDATAWERRRGETHEMGGDDPLFHRKMSPMRTCTPQRLLSVCATSHADCAGIDIKAVMPAYSHVLERQRVSVHAMTASTCTISRPMVLGTRAPEVVPVAGYTNHLTS